MDLSLTTTFMAVFTCSCYWALSEITLTIARHMYGERMVKLVAHHMNTKQLFMLSDLCFRRLRFVHISRVSSISTTSAFPSLLIYSSFVALPLPLLFSYTSPQPPPTLLASFSPSSSARHLFQTRNNGRISYAVWHCVKPG